MILIIVTLTLVCYSHSSQWIRYDDEDCPKCVVYTTETNFSSMISFESKVLIGARNSIYEIEFSEEISTKHEDRFEPVGLEDCIKRLGQQVDDCQNYYKVILQLNKADLFICGTSAFSPVCGVRTISDLSYSAHSNDGLGICPANPRSSTTYLKLKDALFGFAGTERASSSQYAISLVNLGYGSYDVLSKTKSDNHWLNKPEFIYSFEYGDHVYFVLKEIAVEVMSIEQIYSRVVRICKRDHGGGGPFFSNNFVTYLKARIYCSYTRAGQSPYDFNEIGGAYYLNGYLYGLFSGPTSVIETGSVLCRFSMDDITRVFEGKAKYFAFGGFRDEAEAKPFTCLEGRTAQDASNNQLMSGVITSSDPVFYSAVQMRKLVVQSIEIGEESSIIANTATNGGNLIRIGFKENYGGTVRHRILRMQHSGPVVELSAPEDDPTQVYLMSNDWVGFAPLRMECGHYTTCQSCQSAFPYCGWCSSGSDRERVCTTVDQCGSERTWRSPYDNCPPLARFRTLPQDRTVTLTESNAVVEVDLMCESEGAATPSWSRLSSQIASSAKIVEDGTILRLRVDSYMDAGTYICSLKGEAGNVDVEADLTVLVSPTVTRVGPRNVTVPRGEDVTLTCLSDGHPKPTVTWKLKNGSPLPESARIDQNSGELKLIRIVPADAGRYYCEVSNNVGLPKSSRDIEVAITDYNPQDPDSGATIDAAKPFDVKKIIIIVCCALILIIVVAAIVHFVLKKRKRTKEDVPAMYPLTYQEQIYGDMPNTPNTVMTPHYVEEQMQFDWNQAQHLMGQQMLTQQLMGQIGPAMPYLMPQRDTVEDEPPPAYQAEIELHQPPSRRMTQSDQFFTPVQRDSPGYSAGNSMDSHPGHTQSAEPGYSIASIEPAHGGPRGPTPPPRTDIRPPPTSSMEVEVETDNRSSPGPDPPTNTSSPPPQSSDHTQPPPSDAESIHEYERIGLLSNAVQNASLASEQDNGSSRGSSLLQT
ncbi:semaphorin-4A-like isoform X1 [Bolinopsis microptera]|uniref:semaphorin-4A-like isoform X1 n=1 Tax=Bolinopsis microptera TaxID=2820187 RepID=UPI003079884E